ncbi:AMP-binding protein [Cryobacterium psychrophilum]|uniref:4-coumarate--CoA ligase family protein n=1 Tax=Cryobacterium psychrophilum TaxID=41988 RepID=A0A4Y8KL22_9MICO|nr:AMP-binding protein [Cryobacterium psychrophilum]TDW30044.1 acyl-CoA synthetase (AMP-forming)/AMP-acid ligase II [Cryobacterium psychrophilum]TFD75510.1 4-coumarate--CoA ligase family protein [Cryobacterium psychrophilum]
MFTSPYAPVVIPDESIYDYLFSDLTEAELDQIAIVDGATGAPTSYRTLVSQINRVAAALAERGVAAGTVVGLLCPNIPAFASVFHGILRSGATVTTVNSLYTPGEIQRQLEDSGATWLMTVSPLLAGARAAAHAAGIADDRVVVLDGAPGHPSLADLLATDAAVPDVSIDSATHVAVLPFSSGTTGRAKGVMLSHRNLVANVQQARGLVGVVPEDRVLALLPFFHIYGMTVLLNLAFKQRAALVTMAKFDLTEFLRIIQDERCSYVFIAPPIAVALAKHPLVDSYDLSSVHTILSGAAPLSGALAEAVATRLGCRILQGYGMTEASPVSHLIPIDAPEISRDSVGVTIPNMDCMLVSLETGEEIPLPSEGVSGPGELLVRGPNVMLGYLGNDQATHETIDADGFLHTGDVATVNAQGVVRIVDRSKELIKYKGYQIAPAELEALLLSHVHVADVAVIGVQDADGQEIPKAFIVAVSVDAVAAEVLMEWVAERVAPHKKVRVVEFIDVIPKSASGKILRKDLRAREVAGA